MTDSREFLTSDRNRVRRIPSRGAYDKATIFSILDTAPLVHVGIESAQGVAVIPMFHARRGDEILLHGSSKSRLLTSLASGAKVCVTATILDGLVLARSLFHHSMNYRSAVVFGSGRELAERSDKLEALRAMSEKLIPGRWDNAREPNDRELKATAVIAIQIESASAKIRKGDPVDDAEDHALGYWAGVVPLSMNTGAPMRAADLAEDIKLPGYLEAFTLGQ